MGPQKSFSFSLPGTELHSALTLGLKSSGLS